MSTIQKIVELYNNSQKEISLCGLTSPSQKAYVLKQLKKWIHKPFLIICNDEADAEKLAEDLSFFHENSKDVVYLPAWEKNIASLEEASDRSSALFQIIYHSPSFIVSSPKGISKKTLPRKIFEQYCLRFKQEAPLNLEEVSKRLFEAGYIESSLTDGPGIYSQRGHIFDIFPPYMEEPFRIELFGDEILSIRLFNPETQVSHKEIEECFAMPLREIILNHETKKTLHKKFKFHADNNHIPKKKRDEIIENINNGIFSHNIDLFLPFLYEETSTAFEYLSSDVVIFSDSPLIFPTVQFFSEELQMGGQNLYIEESEFNYFTEQRVQFYFKSFKEQIQKTGSQTESGMTEESVFFDFKNHTALSQHITTSIHKKETPLDPLVKAIKGWGEKQFKTHFICHGEEQKLRLTNLIGEEHDIQVGQLSEGLVYAEDKIVFITEDEIFGKRKKVWHKSQRSREASLLLQELKPQDYVVHASHGIGKFIGLQKLTLQGMSSDFLFLEYANKDKLYVPVHRMNLIQKYIGSGTTHVPLDQLGTLKWHVRKKKASEDAEKLAKELLHLYAKRHKARGFAFSSQDTVFEEFESTFPFEETPDQEKSIQEVLADMASEKPMDRLICGDVGFGKTEIAMRASFKAVLDHKQVAFLVPTTLLAHQHYQSFRERFKKFPVNIEVLSRFISKAEQTNTLKKTASGLVDIIIGTHRILSKDVQFKDLGLLILDEEQRFGVLQKEKLKKIKENIDILTLTATPIPRTLHMALSNLRDLSLITTPPLDRHSVKTYISPFSEKLIREAILKETTRGGQVFFLHNRVQTIDKITKEISLLVPGVSVTCAHGQMKESQLEEKMMRFLKKEYNVLVCTTIIGSGLDIPSCNTIIINRADALGLSELYQLRGRVGRSYEQAYCYLLIPHSSELSDTAKMRLSAIERHTELGTGYNIASEDLEIRGAGNLLGSKQSGQISGVGLEMYIHLIEEAAQKLQGKIVEEQIEPEINIKIKALIPSSYVKDMELRLSLYKKISLLEKDEEAQTIIEELQDRFGEPPSEVLNLFELMNVKNMLRKLKVSALLVHDALAQLTFTSNNILQPEKILHFVRKNPEKYEIRREGKLVIRLENSNPPSVLEELKKLLHHII